MKITQTETKLELVDSGVTNLIVGLFMTIFGLFFAVAIATNKINSNLEKPIPLWVAGILAAVCLVGVYIVMKAQNKTTVFDKAGPSSIKTKQLIGGKITDTPVNIASIASVELSVHISDSYDSNNRRQTQRQGYVSLVMTDKQKILIANSSNTTRVSFNIFGFLNSKLSSLPLEKEATQIATFLGVPLTKPNIEEALEAVQTFTKAIFTGKLGSLPKAKTDKDGNIIGPIE